jgi:hypothetical protein
MYSVIQTANGLGDQIRRADHWPAYSKHWQGHTQISTTFATGKELEQHKRYEANLQEIEHRVGEHVPQVYDATKHLRAKHAEHNPIYYQKYHYLISRIQVLVSSSKSNSVVWVIDKFV